MGGLEKEIWFQFGAAGVICFSFAIMLKWILKGLSDKLGMIDKSLKMFAITQIDMHKSIIRCEASSRCLSPDDMDESNKKAHDFFKVTLETLQATKHAIERSLD